MRIDLDVRRVWECPTCHKQRRASMAVASMKCDSCSEHPFMTIASESTPRRSVPPGGSEPETHCPPNSSARNVERRDWTAPPLSAEEEAALTAPLPDYKPVLPPPREEDDSPRSGRGRRQGRQPANRQKPADSRKRDEATETSPNESGGETEAAAAAAPEEPTSTGDSLDQSTGADRPARKRRRPRRRKRGDRSRENTEPGGTGSGETGDASNTAATESTPADSDSSTTEVSSPSRSDQPKPAETSDERSDSGSGGEQSSGESDERPKKRRPRRRRGRRGNKPRSADGTNENSGGESGGSDPSPAE